MIKSPRIPKGIQVVKQNLDEWANNPLSIKSTFILKTQAYASKSQAVVSGTCGLGWRFRFVCTSESEGPTGGITIYFDPHYLGNSAFGEVETTVTVAGVNEASIVLPSGMANSLSFHKTEQALFQSWFPWSSSDGPSLVLTTVRYTVGITITFSSKISIPPIIPLKSILPSTMKDSIKTGQVVDLKFRLYRGQKGNTLTRPGSLYGTAAVLRGRCQYLDTLIDGEDFKNDQTATALPDTTTLDELDYDSDSDFESDVDESPPSTPPLRGIPQRVDTVDETDENIASPDPKKEAPFIGRVICMPKYSYTTWKAFIEYLYTGEIAFSTLRSQTGKLPCALFRSRASANRCSPKSMYRLADELDLPDLRELALNSIKASITTRNVIPELLSKFSQLYPVVEEFEMQYLLKNPQDYHGSHLPGLLELIGRNQNGQGTAHSKRVLREITIRSLKTISKLPIATPDGNSPSPKTK